MIKKEFKRRKGQVERQSTRAIMRMKKLDLSLPREKKKIKRQR
jgi:hypothetical protein